MKRSVFLLGLLSLLAACKPDLPDHIAIVPVRILAPGDTVQLASNVPATWHLSGGGTLSSMGLYTAGDSAGVASVMAVSVQDTALRAFEDIFISPRADLLNRLRAGGYVLYFRHAEATVGNDQFDISPGWYLSCNSDTARQLSPGGRVQATEIGQALRRLRIPLADTVRSSVFCRCIETAQRMMPDQVVQPDTTLTFYVYEEYTRFARTQAMIDAMSPGSDNQVLISHTYGAGSSALPFIEQGYMAVFVPQAGPGFAGMLRDDELRVFK
ncbi:MAG: hypothetical protein OHK0039_41490 [Bacteroidia bacterium]